MTNANAQIELESERMNALEIRNSKLVDATHGK